MQSSDEKKRETRAFMKLIPLINYSYFLPVVVNVRKPKRLPVLKTFRHLSNYKNEELCLRLLENYENYNMI